MLELRRATMHEVEALADLDERVLGTRERAMIIRNAVSDGTLLLAVKDGTICGFGIVGNHFFDQCFLEILVVSESHRRRGVASSIVKEMMLHTQARKFFTSTNRSNLPMQALLERLGFVRCGYVDHLDEGDPELIYVHTRPSVHSAPLPVQNLVDATIPLPASAPAGFTFLRPGMGDVVEISDALTKGGYPRKPDYITRCIQEMAEGQRIVYIVQEGGHTVGFVNLLFRSFYPSFVKQDIPEINDLVVLPAYRQRGIATTLIAACEESCRSRALSQIGLGVGLFSDYGAAQRLYARLGFVPDGHGLQYNEKTVPKGETVRVDDDLVLYLTKQL